MVDIKTLGTLLNHDLLVRTGSVYLLAIVLSLIASILDDIVYSNLFSFYCRAYYQKGLAARLSRRKLAFYTGILSDKGRKIDIHP